MLNYFRKYSVLLFCCIFSFSYTMENGEKQKAITELLNIIKTTKNCNSPTPKEWSKALLYLEQNNNIKSLTLGVFKTPLILYAVRHQQRSLFDYLLLELGTDINVTDKQGNTSLHELVQSFNENPFREGISVEYLLQNKANIETKNRSGHTPLYATIIPRTKTNFTKLLIEHKANVNLENCDRSLLKDTIDRENVTKTNTINTLITACNFDARVTDIDAKDNTIFHLLATKPQRQPELVKTIMTYARINKKATETIKMALLVFNRLNNPLESEILQEKFIKFPTIPNDIQILILSKVLSPDFFHKGLYATLLHKNYKLFSLNLAVNNHVKNLQKILKIKNKNNKTALELLPANYNRNETITEMEKLLNPEKIIKNDWQCFNNNFPNIASIPEKNLVLQIFRIHYAAPEKKQQQNSSKKE